MPEPGATRTRVTRQRTQILALMEEALEFRSAQQLHLQLRERGTGIGLATVYRTLQALAEVGEVDQRRLPSGEQQFRRCAVTRHHHHLICRSCGRAVEIADGAAEMWAERIAREHGFTQVAHTLEVEGLCPDCTSREQPEVPSRNI